jgi:hypothetical protein
MLPNVCNVACLGGVTRELRLPQGTQYEVLVEDLQLRSPQGERQTANEAITSCSSNPCRYFALGDFCGEEQIVGTDWWRQLASVGGTKLTERVAFEYAPCSSCSS